MRYQVVRPALRKRVENRKKLFLSVDNRVSVPYTRQVLRNATLLDRGGYRS